MITPSSSQISLARLRERLHAHWVASRAVSVNAAQEHELNPEVGTRPVKQLIEEGAKQARSLEQGEQRERVLARLLTRIGKLLAAGARPPSVQHLDTLTQTVTEHPPIGPLLFRK